MTPETTSPSFPAAHAARPADKAARGPSPLRALRARLAYPKLRAGPLRVLLCESGYHVQTEVRRGLTQIGHQVRSLQVGEGPGAARNVGEATAAMLRALALFRPDLVVTINHLGVDRGGEMGALLAELEVPIASWYVDCPFLVHDGALITAPQHSMIFVWERAFVAHLQRAGWPAVGWLPLACDSSQFVVTSEAGKTAPGAGSSVQPPVTFVGNSMQAPLTAWWARLDAAGRDLASASAAHLRAGGRDAFLAELGTPAPHPDPRMTALGWGTYRATAELRAAHLGAAARQARLQLIGDAGWATWLPDTPRAAGMLPYGPQLAEVYRRSPINLNITSLQMPTAVNQRVFDVPAAGGFLLTDSQADMAELFPPDARATFASADELSDQLSFYARRPDARSAVARAAQKHVLAHHTYAARLTDMLAQMRNYWAART